MLNVYEQTKGQAGLSILPKLKYEHVHLTSFSKMRVGLAAQILNKKMLVSDRIVDESPSPYNRY